MDAEREQEDRNSIPRLMIRLWHNQRYRTVVSFHCPENHLGCRRHRGEGGNEEHPYTEYVVGRLIILGTLSGTMDRVLPPYQSIMYFVGKLEKIASLSP